MADTETTEVHGPRFRRSADSIRERSFPIAVRGYDRRAVDAFVAEVVELVTELEGRQSREAVVQRALDEVGEETAGILQRAHETADEIAARSRAQAEGRIQRAEREADLIRRQAEAYSEQVVVDTRLLWDERQRLIEEIRQLADEVLATADDAAERLALPAGLEEPETPPGGGPALAPELPPEPFDATAPDADEPITADGDPDDEAPIEPEAVDPPTAEVEFDVLEGGAGRDEQPPPNAPL